MRILIAGAGGLVGTALRMACERDDVRSMRHGELDIADPVAAAAALDTVRPDVVVNAAAIASPDTAAADPDAAFRANAVGPRVLGEACRRNDCVLVQLSTDYVFAGDGGAPYNEWSPTPVRFGGPVNEYGRSKLAGEIEVRAATPAHYIVRTSWVFGRGGGASQKVIDEYVATGTVRAWDDQWNVPTPVEALAETIRRLAASGRFGTYHVCGSGKLTRYEFAREVLELIGADPECVVATSMADEPKTAPRPVDTEMDTMALRLNGFEEPGDWRPALRAALQ